MIVPKLRFKGFDQDWTGLKIKDLVKSLDAGVSVNSEDVEPKEDEYSVLKTSCISSGYFDENERKRVLQDGEIQRLKEPVLDDSILMSRMNTPLLVGMNAYVFKAPKNTFLPDRLWQLKIDDNKTVTRWLAFYLGSDQGLNQIRDLASGTSNSMKNITKPDVLNLDLFVPSKEEQTKIASFLSTVDEKISRLTQKHQLLNQYKQGMMQKLFSQQFRFKADDGSEFEEWEEKKLGDIFKVTSGATPLRSDERFFKDADISWVKTTDLNNGLILKTEEKISQIALQETSVKILPKGTVFVAMYGGFNQIGRTGLLVKEAACNQALSAIYPNQNINSYFLLAYLNYKVEDWKNFAASSRKDPNITKSDVLAFPFIYPIDLKEQTKIANFLSAIDQKIEVVAQQIEQAKTWKKGLLQQMFV
ncbi:restriction endonuclease subunit S (plasmid) [Acinetobacter terrestris]|uniref:Restriction endonuclease subunit S n=1 Tax=Acinetobacter terrestris TaxID=2529843 RepID=A0AAW6UZV9_9GAMM|nr:restriction endonuclease subunit S [Acinetobacter terrestris]MDK1685169.1 restriction endonuclease subunit S [Acinetobacter terrestris]